MKLSELQEKWLQALESGEYKQGKDALRNCDDRFCCLGVGLEVCGISPEEYGVERDGLMVYRYKDHVGFRTGSAPMELVKKLSLFGDIGEIHGNVFYGSLSLAGANDEGASFKEIAAFIRSNPQHVFRTGADE